MNETLSEKRRRAGRRGGLATARRYRRCYMAEIGRRGAAALYERYRLTPYGVSGWALVDRETEQVKARWQQDIIESGGESMDERLRYIIENWHRVPRWTRYKILAKMWIALQRSRWERLGTSAIRHMVKGYYQQAGIVDKRKTTHSLRHSAISKVAKQNVMKARQVARHASIDTTMIYVHENDRLTDPGEQFIDYVNGNGG